MRTQGERRATNSNTTHGWKAASLQWTLLLLKVRLDNDTGRSAVTTDKPGAVALIFNSESGRLLGIHYSYYGERKKRKYNSKRLRVVR